MGATDAVTPEEAISALIADVDALVASGALNKGQGNALKAKLNAALASLEKGHTAAAVNQLQAFVQQVNAFILGGTLTLAEGLALLEAVGEIIAQI